MNWKKLGISFALSWLIILSSSRMVTAQSNASRELTAERLVTGLAGTLGSTIGPDGALYVPESGAGRISRIDPQTGDVTTFASGLPTRIFDIGGPVDIAFIGQTAYVLVTLVGADIGGSGVVGIYRVDDPDSFTIIADIGAYNISHPPKTEFEIPTGLQYAFQPYRGDLLVTDGHLNRVLRVSLNGEITELAAFDNIVPTGLEVRGNKIFMAESGPAPHLPEDGKVVMFRPKTFTPIEVASGASLLVDVEFGSKGELYALSQGTFQPGNPVGSPADPNTGSILQVNENGALSMIFDGLNQPTSLEFIGNTAFIVTLTGEVWKIRMTKVCSDD